MSLRNWWRNYRAHRRLMREWERLVVPEDIALRLAFVMQYGPLISNLPEDLRHAATRYAGAEGDDARTDA